MFGYDPEETSAEDDFGYTEEPDPDEFNFSEGGDDSDYGGYVNA